MSEESMKIIKNNAEDAQSFSDALWAQGDKLNAEFQAGRASGLNSALRILKKEVNHD